MRGLTYLYQTFVLVLKMPATLKAMEQEARPQARRRRPDPARRDQAAVGRGIAITSIMLATVIGSALHTGILVPGPPLVAIEKREVAVLYHTRQNLQDPIRIGG